MYDWQRNPSGSVRDTLKRQKANTKSEFEERTKQTIAEFAEQVCELGLSQLISHFLCFYYNTIAMHIIGSGFERCSVLGEG